MAEQIDTGTKTFTAGAAIGQHLRVKLTNGELALAGEDDHELGTMRVASFAAGDKVAVYLTSKVGTAKFIASGAVSVGDDLYAAADGKVTTSGHVVLATALNATSDDGDVVEGLRRREVPFIDWDATVTADDSESALNTILPNARRVEVAAVTNDANDFIVLPALADVQIGHKILIIGGASSNFEVRTPAASAEEINSEDCDGTKEYLFTDTQLHYFVKIDDTIGWMGHGFSAIGAVVTAVVPD